MEEKNFEVKKDVSWTLGFRDRSLYRIHAERKERMLRQTWAMLMLPHLMLLTLSFMMLAEGAVDSHTNLLIILLFVDAFCVVLRLWSKTEAMRRLGLMLHIGSCVLVICMLLFAAAATEFPYVLVWFLPVVSYPPRLPPGTHEREVRGPLCRSQP